MNGREPLLRVVEEVEYLLARRKRRAQERPSLVIVHGYHQQGTLCVPGETIDRCHLRFPEWEIPIPLALPGLMVCDCMVRHHHTPLSIARMESILTSDPFYCRLGTNSFERIEEMPMFTRVALRVYVARLRERIAKALRKGGSLLLPEEALTSDTAESNVVVHRINLPVKIVHSARPTALLPLEIESQN
jgi:hypothetical protein